MASQPSLDQAENGSTGAQIVFLDRELRIENVAGDADLAFPLDSSTIGKPITDFRTALRAALSYSVSHSADGHSADGHSEDTDICDQILLVQQMGVPFEETIQLRNGRWLNVRLTPVMHGDSFNGLAIVASDITEQRLVQDALQQSEQRYSLALQGMCDGVWEWDMVDNFVFYSPMLLSQLGVDQTTTLPNSIEFLNERIHSEDYQRTWDAIQAHFANRIPFECELRLKCESDELRWFRLRGQAEWDTEGRPTRFASAIQDISELRSASQSLALAKLSVERLAEAIFWVRDDGTFLFVNRSACELLGYRLDELQAMSIGQLDADAANSDLQSLADSTSGDGHSGVRLERMMRRKDGSLIAVEVHVSLLNLDGDSFSCVIARDVTVAKQREERSRDELERHSHFLSVLSHELRNPMSAIVNAARLHTRGTSKPAALSYASEVIQRQSKQMVSLLDDLLDVSRITQGRLELKRESVDLTKLVDQVLEAVEPARSEKGVRIDVHTPSQPVLVDGDPVRLLQIQTNLLANAIKHTTAEDSISLSISRSDGHVQISVKDTGIGIPRELLDRMFEMFVQGQSPQSRSEGMGIGLTLVRALAEMHGGQVFADSDGPGKGAEFRVSLAEIENADSVKENATVPKARRAKRIVIVEDNDDARETLRLLLEEVAEVFVAADGESGLNMIRAKQPDIAIIDIDLPKLSGIQIARQLTESNDASNTKLLALTGHGQKFDKIATQEAGFDDHFIKPLDLSRLEPYLND